MRKSLWGSLKSEAGISFAETIVSLFLLSTLMLVLFRLGTGLTSVLIESQGNALSLRKELLFRKTFDRSFRQILPPWWLREYSLQVEDNRWIFPYRDGLESEFLVLEWEKPTLNIWESDELRHSFSNVETFELMLISQKFGRIICQIKLNDRIMIFSFGGWITPGGIP